MTCSGRNSLGDISPCPRSSTAGETLTESLGGRLLSMSPTASRFMKPPELRYIMPRSCRRVCLCMRSRRTKFLWQTAHVWILRGWSKHSARRLTTSILQTSWCSMPVSHGLSHSWVNLRLRRCRLKCSGLLYTLEQPRSVHGYMLHSTPVRKTNCGLATLATENECLARGLGWARIGNFNIKVGIGTDRA